MLTLGVGVRVYDKVLTMAEIKAAFELEYADITPNVSLQHT